MLDPSYLLRLKIVAHAAMYRYVYESMYACSFFFLIVFVPLYTCACVCVHGINGKREKNIVNFRESIFIEKSAL